jgi:hypothetical protein
MATINGIAIFVESENVKRSINSTDHPTETGLPITSNIQKQAITLSIDGKIVDNGKYKASDIVKKIEKLQNAGSLITYVGRNTLKNLQIQSFDCTDDKNIKGGSAFSMELKEVRIAKSSYKSKKSKSSTAKKQAKTKKSKPNLKVGAKVVFKGGNVYASSDAKKASAKRGRSTCKITKIKNAKWAKHKYHLKSTDGKRVYGWVDKSKIEGLPVKSTTKSKSNGGTQQTKGGKSKAVYHKTKKGDTVYKLVNKNYKSLGKSESWVIKNNPNAFSRKGDPKTLKVGVKLLMGYKS